MSVQSGQGKLKQADKVLRRQWAEVSAMWRDETQRQFERDRIAPLLTRLRAVEMALGNMAAVLDKVRRECG